MQSKKTNEGFRVLIALRWSSFQALRGIIRDYEPRQSPRIRWSLDQMRDLLRRRLTHASKKVVLEKSGIPAKTFTDYGKTIDSFVDLLRHRHTEEFLIKTSNYNLHTLMEKVARMPTSEYFDDRYIFKELEKVKIGNPDHGVPLWVAFDLILGIEDGGFKSRDDVARSGLINCFCTLDEKHEPYTFFARLHLLCRLQKNADENNTFSVRELAQEYRLIFQNNLSFTRVFFRSLFRLVQGQLILTRSCRRYWDILEIQEHIEDDHVYISEVGLYYLEWLTNRIDYLYYIKDDIDWPENDDLDGMVAASVGLERAEKHRQSYIALCKLMDLEFQMLKELLGQLKKPGDSKIAKTYVDRFSAKTLSGPNGEILFTKKMAREFEKYLTWSFPNYRTDLKDELLQINNLENSYQNTISAFLT